MNANTKQSGKKSKGVKAWGIECKTTGEIFPYVSVNKNHIKELFTNKMRVIPVLITPIPSKKVRAK